MSTIEVVSMDIDNDNINNNKQQHQKQSENVVTVPDSNKKIKTNTTISGELQLPWVEKYRPQRFVRLFLSLLLDGIYCCLCMCMCETVFPKHPLLLTIFS
jgi:hypothetical protein